MADLKLTIFFSKSPFKCALKLPFPEFEESSPINLQGNVDKAECEINGDMLGKLLYNMIHLYYIKK